jgi:hypothetical protein
VIRNSGSGFYNDEGFFIGRNNKVRGDDAPCSYVRCSGRGNTIAP